jgi:hypothetical protein
MTGAAQLRFRTMIGALAVAAVLAAFAAGGATSAQAATTCTWGGTPAAPTGRVVMTPGATNTPSIEPIDFTATGVLAGGAGCNGQFTFHGQMDTGATCAFSTFEGSVMGLPGVKRFAGVAPVGILPARLYDKDGNIVGSENAQVDTLANAPNFPNCNTSDGFSEGNFSSVIELFGDRS